MPTIEGVVRGRLIELSDAPGVPDGQRVMVQIAPAEEPRPEWLEHFTVDEAIAPAKIIIKGTRLLAEDMARLIDEGASDHDLLRQHPELTAADAVALREYVKVPATLRRLFGAWADEADELDKFLEERRLQRRIHRPEIDE